MRFLKLLALAAICAFFCAPPPCNAEEGKLLKAVVLSRHGVRAPTQSAKVLESWSRKTWPNWQVERGYLTPRGARLITAMWEDMRGILTGYGILPANQCPPPGSVFVRADVDERTRATARAILEGIGEGCAIGYAASTDKVDPLFHPVKAGLYRFNPVAAATNVLSMTRGGMEKLQEELAGPLALISKISGEPSANLCARFTLVPNCQLTDLPNAISVSADGKNVRLVGGLAIASSLAEIFLLEYGNWPGDSAGWGQVNASTLAQVLPVHSRIFDVVNRAPVIAWARGSSLLLEMTSALFGTHYDQRCNDAKLVVFVGHDTNIANVGSLVGVTWQARGYPLNGIPPGGAFFLELWENAGKQEVRIKFYAQPPQALHAAFNNEAADTPVAGREHAPMSAQISAPPVVGSAIFEANSFIDMVNNVTEAAPIAPRQTPPLEFASGSPAEK